MHVIINSIGSRFGCLHPLTSYRLYNSLCIPILLYGSELWSLSKVELNMFERIHRKILRTIQGLPTRCHTSSLNSLLGSNDIESRILQRKLNFINSLTNLDDSSLPKKLISARIRNASAKGLIPRLEDALNKLNLPDINSLIESRVKREPWKKSIKKQLNIKTYLRFLTDCEEYYVSECDLKIGRPIQHWAVTLGDSKLSRANNFRIRLLVGCDGLEKDAARFRRRNNDRAPSDPSCKLCNAPVEDAFHFISHCPALEGERLRLLDCAPPSVKTQLPDHVTRPDEFAETILGTNWIDDRPTQSFCIEFLQDLRSYRTSKFNVGL